MKAANDSSPPFTLSGPAAAVLVAVVGAALVAAGLLLLGVGDTQIGLAAPPMPMPSVQIAG